MVSQIPGIGIENIFDKLLRIITDAFISQCRFNPQHNAETEQQLYDKIPAWIECLASESTAALTLEQSGSNYSAQLSQEQLVEALGEYYKKIDRAPLIALTDQYPTDIYETRLRQTIDHQKIFSPITKWNTTLQANTAGLQIRHALQVATSGTPGPVHIDIPSPEITKQAIPLVGEPKLLLPERVSIN